MENASKALLIAGGILIAIVITSVLVFMFNQYKSIPKTQEEVKQAEQLKEFNKKYESYHKNNLYGTDVISVINMARSNNKTYENNLANYGIEVHVSLKTNLEYKIQTWYYDHTATDSSQALKMGNETNAGKATISADTDYKVSDSTLALWNNEILDPDKGTLKSEYYRCDKNGNLDNTIESVKIGGTWYKGYYMATNLAYEFKNRRFECTGIEYGANGRVNKLTFVEK